MAITAHHRVVVVGAASAGISVAARLRRALVDVAVIEPSDTHPTPTGQDDDLRRAGGVPRIQLEAPVVARGSGVTP
jgi:2-polyprenyl-6-methoxyphenol hydroxylase-like FAD-dependent oxidoreductase